jgi:hypothetical protein
MIGMLQETKDRKPACIQQQKLIAEVQHHLIQISQLTRAIAEALANGNENIAADMDKQVDLELGKKERAMGALHQHRKEHGC